MTTRPFRKLLFSGVLAALGFCMTMQALPAQTAATGTIRGRVLNETTGQYLEGAFVRVRDTGLVASTDFQGDFVIRGVPVGTQSVMASYLGLGDQSATVEVSLNQMATMRFAFREDVVMMEGITVEAALTGRSAALNQQRVASGVSNVISEEQFGQMNDGNIGLAIQKMPGLSVDTDGFSEIPRYVNIRGVDTQYNNVQLDGNRMPSSGTGAPGRLGSGGAYGDTANGMALDDVPGDAITNVEIFKNPLPEHDGDALGGIVDLVTRSAFQREGRVISYKAGMTYSALRDSYDPSGSLSYSDILGENKSVGVSLTLSYHKVNEGFDNIDYDWEPFFHRFDFGSDEDNLNRYLAPVLSAEERRVGQRVIFYQEDTEFNNYNIERDRVGLNLGFDLRPSERTELYARMTYHNEDRTSDDIRHHLIMDNNHKASTIPYSQFVSPFAASDPNYNAGNYFTFRNTFTGSAADLSALVRNPSAWAAAGFDPGNLVRLGNSDTRIATVLELTDLSARTSWLANGSPRGRVTYTGRLTNQEIEFANFNIGGSTELSLGELTYDAFYARSEKTVETASTRFVRNGFQLTYDRTRDPFKSVWSNLTPADRFAVPTPGAPDDFVFSLFELTDRTTNETYMGVSVDLEIPYPDSVGFEGAFKVGAKVRLEERELDWDELQFGKVGAFPFRDFLRDVPYDAVLDDEIYRIPYTPDAAKFRASAADGNLFTLRETGSIEDTFEQDYTATRDTYAAYAQSRMELGKLEIVAGARVEQTEFKSSQFVLPRFAAGGGYVTGVLTAGSSAFVGGESNFQYRPAAGAAPVTIQRSTRSNDITEFLPSTHFKYRFTDNLISRASWGRTYGRPNFSDLLGIVVVNENNDPVTVTSGNPDLPNLISENYDVSIEYYTNSGGVLSAGFFFKDMQGFSFDATQRGDAARFGLDPALGEVEVTTVEASGKAVNFGIELSVYQRLAVFSELLDGFAVTANLTLTDSDADYPGRIEKLPTRGASNTLYFLALDYSRGGFSGQVSYRFRSQFIEGLAFVDAQESSSSGEFAFVGDDQFDDQGEVDVSLKYAFSPRISVYCNITNLLSEPRFSVQGYRQYGDDAYWNERRINFGVTGEF